MHIPRRNHHDENALSQQLEKDELKFALRAQLENAGLIDRITAQFRFHIAQALKDDCCDGLLSGSGDISFDNRVIRAVVLDFLSVEDFQYSKSVYSSESGLCKREVSRNEVVEHLFGIDSEYDSAKNNTSACPSSILSELVMFVKSKGSVKSRSDISTQADCETAMYNSEENITENLTRFQIECETRLRRQFLMEMNTFREKELSCMRAEEATKYRAELENCMQRLKREHSRRREEMIHHYTRSTQLELIEKRKIEDENRKTRQELLTKREDLKRRESENKIMLETKSSFLDLQEKTLQQKISAVESRIEEVNAKELEFEEGISSRSQKAEEDIRKKYASAVSDIGQQKKFLDENIADLGRERKKVWEMQSRYIESTCRTSKNVYQEEIESVKNDNSSLRNKCDSLQQTMEEYKSKIKALLQKCAGLERLTSSLRNQLEASGVPQGGVGPHRRDTDISELKQIFFKSRDALQSIQTRCSQEKKIKNGKNDHIHLESCAVGDDGIILEVSKEIPKSMPVNDRVASFNIKLNALAKSSPQKLNSIGEKNSVSNKDIPIECIAVNHYSPATKDSSAKEGKLHDSFKACNASLEDITNITKEANCANTTVLDQLFNFVGKVEKRYKLQVIGSLKKSAMEQNTSHNNIIGFSPQQDKFEEFSKSLSPLYSEPILEKSQGIHVEEMSYNTSQQLLSVATSCALSVSTKGHPSRVENSIEGSILSQLGDGDISDEEYIEDNFEDDNSTGSDKPDYLLPGTGLGKKGKDGEEYLLKRSFGTSLCETALSDKFGKLSWSSDQRSFDNESTPPSKF